MAYTGRFAHTEWQTLKKQAGAFMGFFKTAPAEAPTSSPVRSQTSRNQSEGEQTRSSTGNEKRRVDQAAIHRHPSDRL